MEEQNVMNGALQQVMKGGGGNFLFPFFLVPEHVSPGLLRKDMQRLAANGVKGVCVEPNFNKNFAGPLWWEQMDAIMDEARQHGMRVWLQDEPAFPTGSANGSAVAHPELLKVYLEEQHVDAVGPQQGAAFLIGKYLDDVKSSFAAAEMDADVDADVDAEAAAEVTAEPPAAPLQVKRGPELLCVSACRKTNRGDGVDGHYLNLTDKVVNGVLTWDVPEGQWRIFIVYTSQLGKGRPGYLNIFDREAVKLLIANNYEPHYARYAADFGHTFAGFFSDEPEFGNVYSYGSDNVVGRKVMPLPWSAALAEQLLQSGEIAPEQLPALWYGSGAKRPEEAGDAAVDRGTAQIRYRYMNRLTRLYEENFTKQLGQWCRAHGCEYIGHIVEDMGNHARLGCSVGHYFRAMTGQDYAGIDLVLQQIRPGMDEVNYKWQGGEEGGEFFHYGLGKLGSSAAHLDPVKRGRAICEIFAAYGNSLGLKNQKWLFDHMLVRGINHFIPAWNVNYIESDQRSRYESDHQFRYNPLVAAYVNRLCSLFSNGVHVAPVAVLYHAEAEWSGDCMPFEKPVRVLLQHQIDCDVVPMDVFVERQRYQTVIEDRCLKVNEECYHALVLPYARYIPAAVAECIEACLQQEVPVYIVDALPEGVVDEADEQEELEELKELKELKELEELEELEELRQVRLLRAIAQCHVVPLERLAAVLRQHGIFDITAAEAPKALRYYHYKKEETDFFMFFNEDPFEVIRTVVELPLDKPAVRYDAFENRLLPVQTLEKMQGEDGNRLTRLALTLHPYESHVVALGDMLGIEADEAYANTEDRGANGGRGASAAAGGAGSAGAVPLLPEQADSVLDLNVQWDLSLADRNRYPVFTYQGRLHELCNLAVRYPSFSGTMRYEASFRLAALPQRALLSLGAVYETAEVWINGVSAGVRICPPYYFEISGLLKADENFITIEVLNTLVNEKQDTVSKLGVVEPSGLLGPVRIVEI